MLEVGKVISKEGNGLKKFLSIFIFIPLVFTIITGCSSPQKTEEELKAEIRKEIEAEEKLRKELEAEISAEIEAESQKKEGQGEEQKEESTNVGQTTTKEVATIILSAFMTKDQIKEKLGHNYTFETEEADGYTSYYSRLKYDGIEFSFGHDDKKLPTDQYPDFIRITSNNYKFNYDFNIGDSALDAIEYCEKNFENGYDRHSDSYMYDVFQYKEDNTPKGATDRDFDVLIIRWKYNTSESFYSKDEISQDVKIESIDIFTPLD